ncbi:peptidoglycan editing factor PgeF [Bacillus sp. FJAT-29790]|uniref:peptidoglycan editing factor PgeF n=1 Tax=Bacillus sp. FJAT-29790 TaxID=1895002 RepID=UPI001C22D49F|nr:peptidoglycan editing factor PgeF [Bacillus sp. FJAT-29790]MBU8877738.1 peptidoglycan editing factor PgeF [Bacillus sp. FJAT-29790]
MEPFILKNSEYFVIKEWAEKFHGLTAGFTSKNGGCSQEPFSTMNVGLHVNDSFETVSQNRKRMANLLDFPLDSWIGAEQTHEVHIEKVSLDSAGKGSLLYDESFKGTDGFFTFEKGILLTLCYADCVPLFFCHEATGAIGAAHAGWKGTVYGIAREMVQLYQREGMDEKGIHVIIGPSICEKCYIVDDRVISLVENKLEDIENKPYNQVGDNQFHLDLKQLNKEILLKAGIMEKNMKVSNLCTSCDTDHFFSHRRDKGKTGRMMSFIGWKEDLQT